MFDPEERSNLNLVSFFLEELHLFQDGAPPREIWTPGQRKCLRKYRILREQPGQGLELTEYGQQLLREAQRHGGDA